MCVILLFIARHFAWLLSKIKAHFIHNQCSTIHLFIYIIHPYTCICTTIVKDHTVDYEGLFHNPEENTKHCHNASNGCHTPIQETFFSHKKTVFD